MSCSLGLCTCVHPCTRIHTQNTCAHICVHSHTPLHTHPHTHIHTHTFVPLYTLSPHFSHTFTHSVHPCTHPHPLSSQTQLHTPIVHTLTHEHTHVSCTPSLTPALLHSIYTPIILTHSPSLLHLPTFVHSLAHGCPYSSPPPPTSCSGCVQPAPPGPPGGGCHQDTECWAPQSGGRAWGCSPPLTATNPAGSWRGCWLGLADRGRAPEGLAALLSFLIPGFQETRDRVSLEWNQGSEREFVMSLLSGSLDMRSLTCLGHPALGGRLGTRAPRSGAGGSQCALADKGDQRRIRGEPKF